MARKRKSPDEVAAEKQAELDAQTAEGRTSKKERKAPVRKQKFFFVSRIDLDPDPGLVSGPDEDLTVESAPQGAIQVAPVSPIFGSDLEAREWISESGPSDVSLFVCSYYDKPLVKRTRTITVLESA